MKPSEVIDKALGVLGPNGEHWMQGDLASGDSYCMAGAMMKATGILGDTTAVEKNELLYHQTRDEVERFTNPYGSIVAFNDRDGRKFDEVREVFEKARAGLQEKGL